MSANVLDTDLLADRSVQDIQFVTLSRTCLLFSDGMIGRSRPS